jgi:hypothetical protein
MGDLNRGRELFTKRIEYPLPKQAGAKDYVFYFVQRKDPFRDAGNAFFKKFYANHVAADVRTLEDLIDVLAAVDGGVTHIREIVILSHATPIGMLFPVVNGVTKTNLREYKYLTAFSLTCLQKDLEAGKFPALNNKREKVIARLREDSWVTLRACNFGRSVPGMYALHAFFGGKANVYAPMVYQFFGTPFIDQGMRLDSRLRVHEHLVKQHFLPKDVHTLERKDLIVTAILDRAKFSEPFEIASMRVNNPPPEEVANYEPFIDELNAGSMSAKLKSIFASNGFTLSKPRVSEVSRNTHWQIIDKFRHEDSTFTIQYDVYESVEFDDRNRQMAVLRAGASILDKPSAKESFPIQLFLTHDQNDRFRGKRLRLAGYTDDPDVPPVPAEKARFDAVLSVLKAGAFAGDGVDIKADLKNQEDIELSDRATLTKVKATGEADAERITWAIRDNERFKIQLELQSTPDGQPAHTITVYNDYANEDDKISAEYKVVAVDGTDPDSPGTELAAYLDRISLDDLLSVLEYLRSPFKPVHAYYIQHVQQALARKKGFRTWLRDNAPIIDNTVLPDDPFRALLRSEYQAYAELSYSFEFNSVWAEVKASNPSKTAFRNDLYAEEDLATTFKIPEQALINRRELPELDSDSPGADIEALRALESVGFEPFFKADKNIVAHAPEPTSLDCAEFEEIVKKWQEVKDLEPEGMREVLEALKTKTGKSYWDVLDDFKSHVKAWFQIVGITIPGIDWVVLSKKDFAELVLKKAPYLSRIVVLQAILEAEFVFTIPLTMWLDFAEAQVESRFYWYTVGRITVMRQWLRELEDLTFRKEIDSPSQIDIDVTIPLSNEPYYISRYNFERFKSGKFLDRFIAAPDRLKDGFDDQARVIHRLGEEILSTTDEVLGDVMRDSGLEPCQIEVLRKAGIFDVREHKSFVIRQLANELLAKLPTV